MCFSLGRTQVTNKPQVTEHIHLAGDYLTNPSIDGALRAGESAARDITETLEIMA